MIGLVNYCIIFLSQLFMIAYVIFSALHPINITFPKKRFHLLLLGSLFSVLKIINRKIMP